MAEGDSKTEITATEKVDQSASDPAADKSGKQEQANEPVVVPEPAKHRAIVLASFGGCKHLRVENRVDKTLEKNEVKIDVEACGINFLDIMVRQGMVEQTPRPPFVPGSECAGTITEVGEDVKKFKVGDRVVAFVDSGAWAETVVAAVPVEPTIEESAEKNAPSGNIQTRCSNSVLLQWPPKLSASKAAVMGFAYLPAYFILHRIASVRTGDIILIHSAGGGIGTAIGQLAKTIQNVKLIGSASKGKHERLAAWYDHLLTPDQDTASEVKKLYPQGIDVILDCLSGDEMAKSYGLLKPLGKYIIYGMSNLVTGERKNFFNLAKHWFHVDRINPLRLHEENHVLGGFSLKHLLFPRQAEATNQTQLVQDAWTELTDMVNKETIDPLVDSEWRFEEAKEAMLRLQERKNFGKVVLLPKLQAPTEVPLEEPPKSTSEDTAPTGGKNEK